MWWLIEARKPPRTFGRLSEAEAKELYEEAYGPVEDQPFYNMRELV